MNGIPFRNIFSHSTLSVFRYVLGSVLFFSLLAGFSHDAFANKLGNAGFEIAIGNGVGENWDDTNGATRVNAATATGLGFSAPPEGSIALRIQTTAQFTFQTFDTVKPGDYVSFSGLAESAIAPVDGGELRIEFKKLRSNGEDELISAVNSTRITTGNAPAGGGFVRFTVTGTAPPETGRVVFVLREQGANGNVLFDNLVAEVNPAKLHVSASKNHAKAGDLVTIHSRFQNQSGASLTGVELVAEIPRGLDFIPDSIRVNGSPVRFREGSLILPVGTLVANQTMDASFQVLVTSGTTAGKQYEIEIFIRDPSLLSERGIVRIIVKKDPVFDEGTIIGKVFHDADKNGVQDRGEKGVPWVRLMTESGIIIVTDEKGRYHIPAVTEGRHLIKIDGHSLPDGTEFITEETFLVKTTPGLMNKANFAVFLPESAIPEEFHEDLNVMITQGLDTAQPALGVSMEPDLIKTGLGRLEQEPAFKFNINYPDFIKHWYLEIRDQMGKEIWTGFGVASPPSEVVWSGQTETGLLIKPGLYSYQFKVQDQKGHEDWTPLYFFRVVSQGDPEYVQTKPLEIPPVGDFNIFKDGKRSIPLVAKPTIRVQGKTGAAHQVTINSHPVPVDPETGRFQLEVYTDPGDKEVVIASTSPEGETITYRQMVKVKDSRFFMVALGEEQLGMNFVRGRLDTAGENETFKEGFYENGRLAYHLQGKIKGKFLVRSHYDTNDKRSALFTNLDPDDYYPVYGDGSTRDYEGQDSLQRFYLVVEMDRSFVKWGSFETAFTDTELASYNRTLSGLKVHYETLGSTPYGDPKRAVKVFASKAEHRADHNEFAATGGSLYYLRNRRAIEGSEKVRVEIRDKIQDISVSSTDLQEGRDYEIDYDEGRIMLTRPLSSVAASDTIVSSNVLDGNPVYLIVDYEFEDDPNAFGNVNRGLRGHTFLGDHLRLGATAVEEKRQNADYDLRGVDAMLKVGRNSKVTAEYAESTREQVKHAVSHNGGLSFAEPGLLPGHRETGRAQSYLVKGETKPHKNVDLSAFIQNVESGFSNDHIRSQEGYRKYGTAAKYQLTDALSFRYRYDSNEVVSQLRPLAERRVAAPFEKVRSHTAQATYDDGLWLAQAEYLRQTSDIPHPGAELIDSLYSVFPFENAIAGKVGYRLNDRLMPYAKVQTFIQGKVNNQYGGGLRYEVFNDIYAYVEQMIGRLGDSTYFGLEQFHEAGARSYINIRQFDRGIGNKTLTTNAGSSFSITEKTRVYSEREHSTYSPWDGYADIYGYEGAIDEHWDFDARYERRHFEGERTIALDDEAAASITRTNTFNTVYGAIGYRDGAKLKARSSMEFRRDQDTPKLLQWASRNSLEYQIYQDLSFLGKMDFGKSRFLDPDDETAAFAEFNAGFAYRPVDFDKFNALTRYSYLKDIANDAQFSTGLFQGLETDEIAHILSIDLAYDLHKYLGIAGKLAYKKGIFSTAVSDDAVVNSFLWVNRLNFHVTRKWDVALEYRTLFQDEAADTVRHGSLVEVDREFYDYVRLGLGYNFTDFDDDLRSSNDYQAHGPFIRMTGKF